MLVKQVTEVSRNWARVGLDKSRAALELGAHRLQATADRLGTWSNKLASEQHGNGQAIEVEHLEATEGNGDGDGAGERVARPTEA